MFNPLHFCVTDKFFESDIVDCLGIQSALHFLHECNIDFGCYIEFIQYLFDDMGINT
jgi:hypothetical protein